MTCDAAAGAPIVAIALTSGICDGRREHGGPAERVADEQLRRAVWCSRSHAAAATQVVDVRAEVGVGELALAGAETGEVEAQDPEALLGQLGGDARGRAGGPCCT